MHIRSFSDASSPVPSTYLEPYQKFAPSPLSPHPKIRLRLRNALKHPTLAQPHLAPAIRYAAAATTTLDSSASPQSFPVHDSNVSVPDLVLPLPALHNLNSFAVLKLNGAFIKNMYIGEGQKGATFFKARSYMAQKYTERAKALANDALCSPGEISDLFESFFTELEDQMPKFSTLFFRMKKLAKSLKREGSARTTMAPATKNASCCHRENSEIAAAPFRLVSARKSDLLLLPSVKHKLKFDGYCSSDQPKTKVLKINNRLLLKSVSYRAMKLKNMGMPNPKVTNNNTGGAKGNKP